MYDSNCYFNTWEKASQETSKVVWYSRLFKNFPQETSLVVQQLGLHTLNAGGLGSNPGQGTRSCMLQLRPGTAK